MSRGSRKIRVLVVDDHPVVRDGISAFLQKKETLTVVGQSANGEQALRTAKKLSPDVIVLDVSLPDINGAELASRLRALVPKSRLLAFSYHTNPEFVIRMARAGVRGYVVKDKPPAELALAIETVYLGRLYFSDEVSDYILGMKLPSNRQDSGTSDLSTREREVLRLIAEGHANKESARKLGLSVRTVEMHRASLMRKLGISTVAGLTRYAIEEGLLSLSQPIRRRDP